MLLPSCRKKENMAKVLFIHASHNAPIMDLYLQGDKVDQLLAFRTNTNTHHVEKPVDDPFTCVVRESYGSNDAVVLNNPAWQPDSAYTLFIYDDYALHRYAFIQDTFTWPTAGNLKVRFLNLGPDAPALDVFFNSIQIADSLVYYGTDSTHAIGNTLQIPAGTYTITVNQHGSGTNLLTLPPIGFEDNRVLDVYSCGLQSSVDMPFQLSFAAHNN